ncbi:MAG: hypothetical protein AB1473_10150 [Thermodesulfobacteriota bacterium]
MHSLPKAMMSMIVAEAAMPAVTFASATLDKPLYFDLSHPKIIIGLMLGGLIPYLIPAILAAITKWLILRLVLQKEARPKIRRLIAVALLEVSYVFVVAVAPAFVGFDRIYFFPLSVMPVFICGALGLLSNLLVLPGTNRPACAPYSLWKRALLAFGLGLIYWGYLVFIAVLLHLMLHWGDG